MTSKLEWVRGEIGKLRAIPAAGLGLREAVSRLLELASAHAAVAARGEAGPFGLALLSDEVSEIRSLDPELADAKESLKTYILREHGAAGRKELLGASRPRGLRGGDPSLAPPPRTTLERDPSVDAPLAALIASLESPDAASRWGAEELRVTVGSPPADQAARLDAVERRLGALPDAAVALYARADGVSVAAGKRAPATIIVPLDKIEPLHRGLWLGSFPGAGDLSWNGDAIDWRGPRGGVTRGLASSLQVLLEELARHQGYLPALLAAKGLAKPKDPTRGKKGGPKTDAATWLGSLEERFGLAIPPALRTAWRAALDGEPSHVPFFGPKDEKKMAATATRIAKKYGRSTERRAFWFLPFAPELALDLRVPDEKMDLPVLQGLHVVATNSAAWLDERPLVDEGADEPEEDDG